jgi:hypothetical protein
LLSLFGCEKLSSLIWEIFQDGNFRKRGAVRPLDDGARDETFPPHILAFGLGYFLRYFLGHLLGHCRADGCIAGCVGRDLSIAADHDCGSLHGGGPTDALVRTLSERMRASLGQPLIVENVTGAAGTIGVGRVARAAPDGYTVSVGHWSTHVINGALYPLPFDLLKDLEPISLLTSYPMLLLTRNGVPAKNLTELTAWLKANQDKVSVGTIGVGSAAHVAGLYFEHLAGLKFAYVPYRGAAPALQDLIAGRIDLLFDHLPNALPQVREGKVKAYAVTANTRSPPRLISRRWMKPAIRAYTLISGTASGSRRAHRQRSRPSSMPLSWMPLPTRRYASSSLN